ncbi:MAG TPA: hypothetical protein VK973_06490, partial [Arenicellales bacterium]|nr:hypothetical protein [Arenicellales bacterium]
MLYAIDQFVLSGGRALVFVDPYMESDPRGRGGPVSGSDLEPIFEQWGVELLDDSIAADMQFAERVRYRRDGREVVGEFPVWLNLQPTQLDGDDVVTANLGNIFMATPGVLRQREGSGLTVTPLIRTGSRAASVDTSLIDGALSPAAIIDAYEPGSKALTLAARISGTATTAFPDGPPPAAEQEEAPAAQTDSTAHREEGEINVIAVADADLLHEQFWASSQSVLGSRIVIPTASNADFVVNALENLTGSSDLISVRSRGEFSRPFTRVAEIRQGAELRLRSKEQQLLDRLEETEQALLRLEQGKTGDGQDRLVLSEEQQQEIEQFRREKIRIRQELREVRHQLRKDIENLEGWLKFINIGLLPLLITVGATVVGVRRSRRRHR